MGLMNGNYSSTEPLGGAPQPPGYSPGKGQQMLIKSVTHKSTCPHLYRHTHKQTHTLVETSSLMLTKGTRHVKCCPAVEPCMGACRYALTCSWCYLIRTDPMVTMLEQKWIPLRSGTAHEEHRPCCGCDLTVRRR